MMLAGGAAARTLAPDDVDAGCGGHGGTSIIGAGMLGRARSDDAADAAVIERRVTPVAVVEDPRRGPREVERRDVGATAVRCADAGAESRSGRTGFGDEPGAAQMPGRAGQVGAVAQRTHDDAALGGDDDVLRHLVQGASGVGQFELALALATAWLCESSTVPLGERPCGTCASCKLVAARSHPDLIVVVPDALRELLGWNAGGEGEEGGEGGGKKKPSKEIRVEAVRSAIEFATTSGIR